jgi:hypothetical protein
MADVVQRTNVRMVQRGDNPRLTLEPLAELATGTQVGRQDLDRNRPVQPRMVVKGSGAIIPGASDS